MKKFILAYQGGEDPKTDEEGKIMMNSWMAWFTALGSTIVDGGFPTKEGAQQIDGEMRVSNSSLPLSGYSVIQAEDMEEAIKVAKSCPHITANGEVHVFEEMPVM